MRPPSARTAFLVATALALGLPLLGWLGVRGVVGAHGFDTPDVVPPPPTPANLASGRFQRDAAEHFEHVLFGRTELLFLKNGLFDLASAGRYHSGFAGHVIQGRDGWLFERPYLEAAFRTNLPIERPHVRNRTQHALYDLRASLPVRPDGTRLPLSFILAPSKAETLREMVPDRFFLFSERPAAAGSPAEGGRPEPYRTFRSILEGAGVPFVDAADLADADADPRTLFPYGGTHWTVDYAARAVSAAMAAAAPDLPRPEPLAPVLAPGPDDPRDRDLAHLLNVPVPYRRGDDLHAHAVFPPVAAPGTNVVAILGDSFGEQVEEALVRSGLYAASNVVLRFNELPSVREFRRLAARADLLLMVYSAPSLAKTRVGDTATALYNALAPSIRAGRPYSIGSSPFAVDGAWEDADGGRSAALAPGSEAILDLPFSGEGAYLELWPAEAPERDLAFSIAFPPAAPERLAFREGEAGPVRIHLPPGGPFRATVLADAGNSAPLRLARLYVDFE